MCSIGRGGHQSLNQIGRLVRCLSAPLGQKGSHVNTKSGRVCDCVSLCTHVCLCVPEEERKDRKKKRSSRLTSTCPCGCPCWRCWLISQPESYQRSHGLSWWISVHLSAQHRTKDTNTSLCSTVNPTGAERSVRLWGHYSLHQRYKVCLIWDRPAFALGLQSAQKLAFGLWIWSNNPHYLTSYWIEKLKLFYKSEQLL